MQMLYTMNDRGAFFGEKSIKDHALARLSAVPEEFFTQDEFYPPTFRNDIRRQFNSWGFPVPYAACAMAQLAGPNVDDMGKSARDIEARVFGNLKDELNFPNQFCMLLILVFDEFNPARLKQSTIKLFEGLAPGTKLGPLSIMAFNELAPATWLHKYERARAHHSTRVHPKSPEQIRYEFELECG